MRVRLGILFALGLLLSDSVLWSRSPEGEAEARSLYQRLWESLRSARTVHFRSTAHFKTTDFEGDVAASLWTKEGNRMRLEVESRGTMNAILSDRTLNVTETYEVAELNGVVDEARFAFSKD